MSMNGPTIMSGGQTGVDRGALDAAIATDTPCGGYCPKGRRAEDGVIPAQYPLIETESGDYEERTRRNVTESDATLIIHFGSLEGGTELTKRFCSAHSKPLLKIDASKTDVERAEQTLFDFLYKYSARTLNVAGPRRSEHADGYDYAYRLLTRLLRR
ncbi:MAG TPA: putative molybdenum carrier protein [Pseudomonadales bacterium]